MKTPVAVGPPCGYCGMDHRSAHCNRARLRRYLDRGLAPSDPRSYLISRARGRQRQALLAAERRAAREGAA